MTTDELNEIRARLQAATPGPWAVCIYGKGPPGAVVAECGARPADPFVVATSFLNGVDPEMSNRRECNAEFIAHAPSDISHLLDLIAERDAEIAALKHDIERHIKIASEEATEVERLRELVIFYGGLESAPCKICGYDGPGYWQPAMHECARIWHDIEEASHD